MFVLLVGAIADLLTVTGALPALMMIAVEGETGETFPARSDTDVVRVHAPLDMVLISHEVTVEDETNEHDAFSAFDPWPLIVAISPIATPVTEMRGVASSEVLAPLSCALNGAALAPGATVSMAATNTGVGCEAFCARSVMIAVIDHDPSCNTGKVHVRSDAAAMNVH